MFEGCPVMICMTSSTEALPEAGSRRTALPISVMVPEVLTESCMVIAKW